MLLSKGALKTYLSTILLVLAGVFFYVIAASTYVYFYYNYIPNLSFSVPVHLQFHPLTYDAPHDPLLSHPYGVSLLTTPGSSASALVSQQKYDFSIELSLPRSPGNIDAGNFMLNLELLAPTTNTLTPPYHNASVFADTPVIAQSFRPATLKYTSALLETAQKAATLPLYLTGWRQEAETLNVKLMDTVSFDKGWRNIPKALRLSIQSRTRLQIYDCEVHVTAKLGGFRWFMYNYRTLSFVLFTSLFWSVEMGTTLTIWLIAALLIPSSKPASQTAAIADVPKSERERQRERIKEEEEDDIDTLSDTSRNFPTYSRQPPLRYSSGGRIKQEDGEEGRQAPTGPRTGAEADISATDTDEEADFVLQEPQSAWRESEFRDSGLGTSFESGSASGGVARRRSKGRSSGRGAK